MSAKEAYKGYVRAYASHSMKNVYDVDTLDLLKVAQSFGFKQAPFIDLGLYYSNHTCTHITKLGTSCMSCYAR
jgi:hypothetical protein